MNLPVELIREIVEIAVLSDWTTGPALALTCKSINQWVTPLFYASVTLYKENIRLFIRGVELAQCETMDTGAYVRRLCILRDAMQHCDWTLSLCKSISHLLLCPSYRDSSIEEKINDIPLWPTPTYIMILNDTRSWLMPRLPLFNRVTHFYVEDILDAVVLAVCAAMPLTHISFSLSADELSGTDYELAIVAVQFLLQFPAMECVLVRALIHGAPIDDFFGGIWGILADISDERLIVAPGMTRDELIESFETGQSVWSSIEEWKDWRRMARFQIIY